MSLTTTELADRLQVSKGRVSQYVSAGKLDGCYTGDGRARRFDLVKVCSALGKRLDMGQMMGNGAATKRAIAALQGGDDDPPAPRQAETLRDGAELPASDTGRYDLARTQKAEEEARKLRRQNLQEEGRYVLATEVERQVTKVLSQEIAEFEGVLRVAARAVADQMGVDFKVARKILIDTWRGHRAARAGVLEDQGKEVILTAAERDEDI
jgi:hypothetical protein